MWIGSDADVVKDKHYRKEVDNPEGGWSAFFIQVRELHAYTAASLEDILQAYGQIEKNFYSSRR